MNQFEKLKILIGFAVLVCSLGLADQVCRAETFAARVVYVIDGDSLIVMNGANKIHIRMWGIDSPEEGQPFSKEAKEYTSRMLSMKLVTIKPVERDKYGRLVAEVFLRNQNSSEKIIRAGFAWVHVFYCRTKKCRAWRMLEDEARKDGKGLWVEYKPVAPWVWKRERKKNKQHIP